MLFSLNRHRPLFTANRVLNDYVKNSNVQYIRKIIADTEYKNKKQLLFGEKRPKFSVNDQNNMVAPSFLLLSLTTILYYFYSKKN